MRKLAHRQSGNLGEILALANINSLKLAAYSSPDGALLQPKRAPKSALSGRAAAALDQIYSQYGHFDGLFSSIR